MRSWSEIPFVLVKSVLIENEVRWWNFPCRAGKNYTWRDSFYLTSLLWSFFFRRETCWGQNETITKLYFSIKVRSLLEHSCAILISFKIVVIFQVDKSVEMGIFPFPYFNSNNSTIIKKLCKSKNLSNHRVVMLKNPLQVTNIPISTLLSTWITTWTEPEALYE